MKPLGSREAIAVLTAALTRLQLDQAQTTAFDLYGSLDGMGYGLVNTKCLRCWATPIVARGLCARCYKRWQRQKGPT